VSRSSSELSRFLRSRRERITPAQVGLPTSRRRRTPGLRREEVAVLAGVSPTWYTYLEQGREIHPSADVLDSLARVFQLTEDERRYLHVLAHGQAADPEPLDADVPAREILAGLVATTEDSPYPVYAVDLYCDVVAWNPAVTEWYTDFGRLPPEERNMMRWMVCAPEARERIAGWRDDARDIVARWRAMTPQWETDDRLRGLVAEFRRRSPDFKRWWDEYNVSEHRTRIRRFRHPRHGARDFRLIVVEAPEFTPSFVVFHIPA
jgi:transcriptional regulator with XRE-family HTH domain